VNQEERRAAIGVLLRLTPLFGIRRCQVDVTSPAPAQLAFPFPVFPGNPPLTTCRSAVENLECALEQV
jgi:hypothetical protein